MRGTKPTTRSVTRDGVTLAVRERAAPDRASGGASGGAPFRTPGKAPGSAAGGAASPGPDEPRLHETVILLTGMAAPQSVWDPVIARLGPGRRVITYDHRGHGRSSGAEDYDFEALLDDLDAVVRATTAEEIETNPPVLCGWSMGADLAVWYAARNPGAVGGVLALDGALPAEPEQEDAASRNQLRARMRHPIGRLTGWLARVLGVGHRLDPDQLRNLLDDLGRWRAGILAAYSALAPVGGAALPVTVALAGRSTPGTPHGLDERWRAAADELVASFPGIDLRWLDCDHAIPLRVPEQVAELLDTGSARA